MTQLAFQCTYTSREGHCPDCDSWTFHHVLPVRYYWTAAFILVKLLRLQQCRGQGASGGADLKAEFGTASALDFFGEFDMEKKDVREICLSLHKTPAHNKTVAALGQDFSKQDLSKDETIAGIVGELTGPKYGGFAGMKPDQRTDDPKSKIEPKRPPSFNTVHWTHLQDLGKELERCMEKLATEVNGPYACKLTPERAQSLLHHLRVLKNDYGGGVPRFNPSDWRMTPERDWYYLAQRPNASDAKQLALQGICGSIFKLGDDNLGGMILKKTELAHAGPLTTIVVRNADDQSKLQFTSVR